MKKNMTLSIDQETQTDFEESYVVIPVDSVAKAHRYTSGC